MDHVYPINAERIKTPKRILYLFSRFCAVFDFFLLIDTNLWFFEKKR